MSLESLERELEKLLEDNEEAQKAQWAIDNRLKLCKTPLQRAEMLHEMMLESLIRLRDTINGNTMQKEKCNVLSFKGKDNE